MIPLLLSIRNFMCYGTNVPDLNLENIHVACLSGNNGHGKTAILDSITWVLWGKSRTRTQEELVHQGQQSMTVEMEFSSQSQRYRVTRTLSISRSGANKTELNLSVLEDGNAISIMGDTIRDTEQKIIELIHMDYDTFISTSYLKQGDSNHFTKARPNERKKILAEVLDLTYYEKLELLAKDRSRELKSEISKNEMLYERDVETTKGKAALEATVAETTTEINLLSSQEKTIQKKSYEIRSKIGSLQQLSIEESELKETSKNSIKQIDDLEKQIQEWNKEINSLNKLTSRKEEINKRKNELDQATNMLQSSAEARTKVQALKLQHIEIESNISLEKRNIIHQLEQVKTKKNELDNSQELARNVQQNITELKSKLAPILHKLNTIDNDNPDLESITTTIGTLTEQNAVLKKTMEDTRNFHDMLEGHSSDCPLCKQPLSQSSEQLLQSQYETKGRESRRKFDQNIKEISKLKSQHELKTSAIATQLATLSENKTRYERDIAINENELSKLQKSATEIPENNATIQRLTNVLENNLYAENAQIESKKLTESISEIAFNENYHFELESKIKTLTPFLGLYGQLEQAESRTLSLRRIKESQEKVLDTTRVINEKANKRLSVIDEDIKSLPTLESEWAVISKKIENYRGKLQSLLTQREHAQYQLKTIVSLEPKLTDLQTKLTQQKEDLLIYDELTAAFGKNGVQALMIERAVPIIEETANDLLSKLTNNKMTLELELQEGRVDRLTGLPSEELVINISDDTGTRSYESFSGGETFRIDFAIRIALSKLLATRSGAPLPILFIDEGFGSQDSEGQERLTEAIQSIQNQFDKIIVITHIDQMKENFEERIEVVKEATGSTFSLV